MQLFDIVGPSMIGPSSSHTAGAARIGFMVRRILGEPVAEAHLFLFGSFAATGKGHGSDKALVAGLLGLHIDDEKLPISFELAKKSGLIFSFQNSAKPMPHPNTVRVIATGISGKTLDIVAFSVGGGRILVHQINDINVEFSGDLHTLIIIQRDQPGVVAAVANALASHQINIAIMKLYRNNRGGDAIMVIETDQRPAETVAGFINKLPGVTNAVFVPALNDG